MGRSVTAPELREVEAASIRAFVESCAEHFTGRVLDLGCGRSPYLNVVQDAGGEYIGYDRADFPANVTGYDVGGDEMLRYKPVTFDAVLCTQVIQYVNDTELWLNDIHRSLAKAGVLVMTGPTNWPIVEPEDLWRFTASGVARLLAEAGFTGGDVSIRAEVEFGPGLVMPLGWQAVAWA